MMFDLEEAEIGEYFEMKIRDFGFSVSMEKFCRVT